MSNYIEQAIEHLEGYARNQGPGKDEIAITHLHRARTAMLRHMLENYADVAYQCGDLSTLEARIAESEKHLEFIVVEEKQK